MNAKPIVQAVTKIINAHNAYVHSPDRMTFTLTTAPPRFKTLVVLRALLDHAIAPSSVALEFWNVFRASFNRVLVMHGDPADPQSLTLNPRDGEWTTVEGELLTMNETALNQLTEAVTKLARDWIFTLLLPSMFLSPHL
jgi:hypothetical protein